MIFLKKFLPLFADYNSITNIYSVNINDKIFSILVPLGISYFSLSVAGYLIDVYRKIISPENNILKFSLFTTYFPLITSGPVVQFREIKETLFADNKFDVKNVKFGFQRIIWGFIKKTVVAEQLHNITSTLYHNYGDCSGMMLWILIFLYLIELYMNFSGCIDIVIGTSQTLGIKVPEDFNSPFFAKSVSDFYKRWHKTLGVWFKEYLFFPIVRSDFFKKHKEMLPSDLPYYIALAIVWFMLGFWHGISMKFIFATGILPCLYIILERIFNPLTLNMYKKLNIDSENTVITVLRRMKTFFLTSFTSVFFISETFADGVKIIAKAFNPTTMFTSDLSLGFINKKDLVSAFVFFALALYFSHLHEKNISIRNYLDKQNWFVQLVVFVVAIAVIFTLGTFGETQSEFVYKKF